MNQERSVSVIWMSAAHNFARDDAQLQMYLIRKGVQIENLSVPHELTGLALMSRLIRILIRLHPRSILQMRLEDIKYIATSKNVSRLRKSFYILQYVILQSIRIKPGAVLLFRGNNIPLISVAKRRTLGKVVILPHGLYFRPPPENNYYLEADAIITGTSQWPEPEYKGKIFRLGMLEIHHQKMDGESPVRNESISVCITHSTQTEMSELTCMLRQIQEKLPDYRIHVRHHPRNSEVKQLIPKDNVFDDLQKMPMTNYINEFSCFIFPVGFNNRVSNVVYEALNLGRKICIFNPSGRDIVNLPDSSRVSALVCETANDLFRDIVSEDRELNRELAKSIHQSDGFYEDFHQVVMSV